MSKNDHSIVWSSFIFTIARDHEALLLLHFAGLGSTKLSLMAWGIRAHYGLRPNASCIQLNAIATRPRIATQPPCMPLRVWQAM